MKKNLYQPPLLAVELLDTDAIMISGHVEEQGEAREIHWEDLL